MTTSEQAPVTALTPTQIDVEQLAEQVAVDRVEIQHLQERADAADLRADAFEDRLTATEARGAEGGLRLDALEQRASVDREMIAELQAEGLVSQAHADDLQVALHSSRTIGAAIGIVMATFRLDEVKAFNVLARASQHRNQKVRFLAENIVITGDLTPLQPYRG